MHEKRDYWTYNNLSTTCAADEGRRAIRYLETDAEVEIIFSNSFLDGRGEDGWRRHTQIQLQHLVIPGRYLSARSGLLQNCKENDVPGIMVASMAPEQL